MHTHLLVIWPGLYEFRNFNPLLPKTDQKAHDLNLIIPIYFCNQFNAQFFVRKLMLDTARYRRTPQ